MSFLTLAKYRLQTSFVDVITKIDNSGIASKLAITDSHLIDSLTMHSWKLQVPTFLFPNFGVNNFKMQIITSSICMAKTSLG
jgi:hypothetical protein